MESPSPNPSPNVIDEVLFPTAPGPVIVPAKEGTTEQVRAGAVTIQGEREVAADHVRPGPRVPGCQHHALPAYARPLPAPGRGDGAEAGGGAEPAPVRCGPGVAAAGGVAGHTVHAAPGAEERRALRHLP